MSINLWMTSPKYRNFHWWVKLSIPFLPDLINCKMFLGEQGQCNAVHLMHSQSGSCTVHFSSRAITPRDDFSLPKYTGRVRVLMQYDQEFSTESTINHGQMCDSLILKIYHQINTLKKNTVKYRTINT